jgi:hypothetical protein
MKLVAAPVAILTAIIASCVPALAGAHCDTLSGPVIADAKRALERNDVTPALKWVRPTDEGEIREAFARTLKARNASPAAKEVADLYFFETLVRIHRAGEGAPFTGLKAANEIDPGIELADQALEDGSVEKVARTLTAQVDAGIRTRFERVSAARKTSERSVAAGREFVAQYVDYVHFVENIQTLATTTAHFDHGNEIADPEPHAH